MLYCILKCIYKTKWWQFLLSTTTNIPWWSQSHSQMLNHFGTLSTESCLPVGRKNTEFFLNAINIANKLQTKHPVRIGSRQQQSSSSAFHKKVLLFRKVDGKKTIICEAHISMRMIDVELLTFVILITVEEWHFKWNSTHDMFKKISMQSLDILGGTTSEYSNHTHHVIFLPKLCGFFYSQIRCVYRVARWMFSLVFGCIAFYCCANYFHPAKIV